ncbi:MAG: class I SAM-dependent methyltransferase [Tannerella sp.]|jgi:SAM-dependent methyltransferase|nr:class I SAM-dependent methyltransferase [Tannerella sp.]
MKRLLVNGFYFCSGIVFLILAKIKNKWMGYSPKTFSMEEINRCIEYDIHVVDDWLKHLKEYKPDLTIRDKQILELGPGSDLGVGLYLLSKSAKKYTAVDVYDLASKVSPEFYSAFFTYLEEKYKTDTRRLKEELGKTMRQDNDQLNYVCRKDFDLVKAVGDAQIEVVFSNAAFEHFSDFRKTIKDLSRITAPGAVLVVSVDLRTHSRWIRDKDPNNIYRYPDVLYKLLKFNSSPNRIRPYQYRKAFEDCGWKEIVIQPEMTLDSARLAYFQACLNKKFKDPANQMEYLTIWICAVKE